MAKLFRNQRTGCNALEDGWGTGIESRGDGPRMAAFEKKACYVTLNKDKIDEGIIEGYGSTFEEPENHDWYGDVIDPEAFDEDLEERGDEVVMLWQHKDPFGMPLELKVDKRGLYLVGKASDTAENQDRLTYIKDGVVRGLSIGYYPLEVLYVKDGPRTPWGAPVRRILRARLIEISAVTNPANPHARIEGVKSWRQLESGVWAPKRVENDDSRGAEEPQVSELAAQIRDIREMLAA